MPTRGAEVSGDPVVSRWVTPSHWELADADHPAGSGTFAYRHVWKQIDRREIETLVRPGIQLTLGLITVTRGRTSVAGALDPRDASLVYPGPFPAPLVRALRSGSQTDDGDYLPLTYDEQSIGPAYLGDLRIEIPSVVHTINRTHESLLRYGRDVTIGLRGWLESRGAATGIDSVLFEEVGEFFEDGHWNRQAGLRTVRSELTYPLGDALPSQESAGNALDQVLGLEPEAARRLNLGTNWLNAAQQTAVLDAKIVADWCAIEHFAGAIGLEAAERVAELLGPLIGADPTSLREEISRIYGARNQVVHSIGPSLSLGAVISAAYVAEALREILVSGQLTQSSPDSIRTILGLQRIVR